MDFETRPTLPGGTAQRADTPIPSSVGPYKIEGKLSKGGMSILYLAVDPETHDPRVVKVLSPQFLYHPELKGHFHREAEIISLTDHPNIVKLYGHGEWEEGLYIAMEFIRGISLHEFILQHAMSFKRALEVVLQVASALEHLHSHGVIHRDLKPENILLTSEGGVKVIDFGIAQLCSESEEERKQKKHQVIGTPVYMSPEQKKDPQSVTFASDIYSLALITYELALGRLSHGTIHISQLPRGLQPILSKALQPNPADRYQDLKGFITDINEYLRSDAIERDSRGRGYAQDLAEHIRSAQQTLLPEGLPNWRNVSTGLASHQELDISGIYYDFLELEEGAYAILLSEPSSKGVDGIVHAAVLQGMVHALSAQMNDPEKLVGELNDLLVRHPIEEIFTLNFLILNPQKNELRYIACGYGPLWLVRGGTDRVEMIPSNNIAIGIDPGHSFLSVTQKWGVGDTLFLSTYSASASSGAHWEEMAESTFRTSIGEVLYTTPQKQADALLRKIVHLDEEQNPEHRPLTVVSIVRKS